MSSPIKAEIKSVDLASLIHDAKELNLFTDAFISFKPKKVKTDVVLKFFNRFPSISRNTQIERKTVHVQIHEEKQFFDVLLGLIDVELSLLDKKINESIYDETRSSIIREFRRQVPFTSKSYGWLENELTREKIMIDTSSDEFKENVEKIVARVKQKRQKKSITKRTGLLD
jgi:hypothetical protein